MMTSKEHELLRDFLDLMLNYLQENPLEENKVLNYQDYQSLEKALDTEIGQQGVSEKALLLNIQSYLQNCVRTIHPQFFGKSYAAYSIPSLMGEILAAVTNTSMATYVGTPAATVIENALIQKMAQIVGFKQGDGIFLTGGTQANLTALLCARNQFLPEAKKKGVNASNLALFVSDQAHYSFISAVNVLGIGVNNLIRVQSDAQGRMDVQALENAIELSIKAGKRPFFIGATAGTTVLGAFDPIAQIAAIAAKYQLWLHIDGAYCGSFLLSKRYKYLLQGCELADSFSWDAHKLMGVPLPCSVILTKNKGVLYQGCTTGDISKASSYVFHNLGEASCDLGEKSLQCTRKVDALKLWLAFQYYGDQGYENRMNRLWELAQYAADKINASSALELVFPRQSVNLCFRYRSKKTDNLNPFNRDLKERLIRQGNTFLNYSTVNGVGFLRMNILNPDIPETEIDYALEQVTTVGLALENDLY